MVLTKPHLIEGQIIPKGTEIKGEFRIMKLSKDTLIEGKIVKKGTEYEIDKIQEGADLAPEIMDLLVMAKKVAIVAPKHKQITISEIEVGSVSGRRESVLTFFGKDRNNSISIYTKGVNSVINNDGFIILNIGDLIYQVWT